MTFTVVVKDAMHPYGRTASHQHRRGGRRESHRRSLWEESCRQRNADPSAPPLLPLAHGDGAPDVSAGYVVKAGETGLEIAARFGIALADLVRANNMTETQLDFLQIGQQLRVPR